MADTVLESFLIKLGYQIDQASQKSFTTAIAEGVKGVTQFATALMAMAVGVEEAVRRTAAQMTRLESQALLSGKSSQELKRLGTSIEAVGGSYQGAIEQQVKFNETLLRSPWLKGWAQQVIGQHSLDIKGVTERYHELAVQYGEGSSQMRVFVDEMAELGVTIGENQRLAHLHWDVVKRINDQQEREDANFKKRWEAAENNAFRLNADFVQFGSTIEKYYKTALGGLMGYLADVTENVQSWLQDHEKDFNDWMDRLEANAKKGDWGAVGKQIGEAIQSGLKYVYDHIDEWTEAGEKVAGKFVDGFFEGLFGAEAARQAKQLDDFLNWLGNAGGNSPEAQASRERGRQVAKAAITPPPGGWGASKPEGAPDTEEGETVSFEQGWNWLKKTFHFQHGGIVPAALHSGEMVLPQPISSGLQNFFGDTGWDDSMDNLSHWLEGDTTFAPIMQFSDQAYDKLVDVFEEALMRVFPDGGRAGVGEGFGGGGGSAAGALGRRRMGGGGAAGSNDYTGQGSEFLKNQRARMAEEIKNNPEVGNQILAMATLEDARDPAGPIEALFNRAAYTGKSLMSLLHSGFYGPINRGMLPGALSRLQSNPQLRAKMQAGLDAVIGGLNRLKGATDQGTAGDPNANQTSGRIFPQGATPGAIYVDWGGGPGGVAGAARWREEQQRHVASGGTNLLPGTVGGGGTPFGGSAIGRQRLGEHLKKVAGAISSSIQAVVGDSITVGLAGALGLPGAGEKTVTGAGGDAVTGSTPEQIFGRIQGHLKDFAGKTVAVAAGSNLVNGKVQYDYIKKILASLQSVGAHAVLLGVGKGVTGNADEVNKQLGEIAKQYGDAFTGGLEGTTRHGRGVVHPSSYKLTRGQVERALQSADWWKNRHESMHPTAYNAGGRRGDKPTQVVDNSHNVTVIHGQSNPHDVIKTAERVTGDRHAAQGMRWGGTMVS